MAEHKLKSTALPYAVFSANLPIEHQYALAGVGRCRITVDDDAITAKCRQQALTPPTDEKERKKYMKEGVALASRYFNESRGIDVSIVNVEVMIENLQTMIVDTDGCLASCYLDAGAASLVFPIATANDNDNDQNLLAAALEAAQIPRERVILHAVGDVPESVVCAAMIKFQTDCMAISLEVNVAAPPSAAIMEAANAAHLDVILQLNGTVAVDADVLGKLCQHHETAACVAVGLVDPTPEQLGRAYAACIKTDRPDGLFTTVVCTRANEALGLVYSNTASIIAALECGRGVYYSRSRNSLWRKGDTSGHHQILHRLDLDCDGDALRFTVTQCSPAGGGGADAAFCHLQTLTCWGEPHGLRHLEHVMQNRIRSAPAGSYTKRLFDDPTLLRDKLVEEAQELAEADTPQHVAEELADVLYFALARAVKAGVTIDDAVAELDRRNRKVTRRPGDRKAFRIEAGDAILNRTKNDNDK
jgi:phosphoribosyl-ATP pyrophosphohydrolase / phosphoribosyl-AMP cyclohydrolase / histidinol dehydrogenase